MYIDSRRTAEKENKVHEFTVLFWDDHLRLGEVILAVGQCVTELLNTDNDALLAMRHAYVEFAQVFAQQLCNPEMKKDLALIQAVQDKMNRFWETVFELPPYRYLNLDKDYAQQFFISAYQHYPEQLELMTTVGTHENYAMTDFMLKLERIFPDAVSMKTYLSVLLDLHFEHLKKRDPEHYAVGVFKLLSDTEMMNRIAASLPDHPDMEFKQSSMAVLEYVPMPHPEDEKKYVMAERLEFDSLGDFLRADFFRGIMRGNAPRRCHNCGKYFLLTSGYNICYCTGVAPGEVHRTCRQIGAHKKELRREGKTPAQVEYYRTYNRLKTRKNRGKISVDEWNARMALAQQLRDAADGGELGELELKRKLGEL